MKIEIMEKQQCRLILQQNCSVSVTIADGQTPVISPGDSDITPSSIAMAVNFLRSGSPSVKLIVEMDLDILTQGFDKWLDEKKEILYHLSIPGEKLVLERVSKKGKSVTIFNLVSQKIECFPH